MGSAARGEHVNYLYFTLSKLILSIIYIQTNWIDGGSDFHRDCPVRITITHRIEQHANNDSFSHLKDSSSLPQHSYGVCLLQIFADPVALSGAPRTSFISTSTSWLFCLSAQPNLQRHITAYDSIFRSRSCHHEITLLLPFALFLPYEGFCCGLQLFHMKHYTSTRPTNKSGCQAQHQGL